jgi:hypothetical protein
MENLVSKQPICVWNDGTGGPYIMVPEAQLEQLRSILDQHGVRYWVDELVISFNEEPPEALVNFGRDADATAVQKILDSVF